jgi:hypothetical protein
MLTTPAFWLCLLAFGLLLCREALEQRFQSCQQALFVAIAQRHLHRAASQGNVDIRAGWRLWQCRDWLSLWLCLGLLGWWLAHALAGMVKLV